MVYLGETFNAVEWSQEIISAVDELRAHDQWVAWKYVLKEGATKPDKLPVNPLTGKMASHSDPRTWSDYLAAWRRAKSDNLAGVGFVLCGADQFTGIDLDSCRDPDTEQLEPWAQEIIDLAETYAEISPSGKGIRLFARGKIERSRKSDKARVELYGAHRYLTITGNHIDGTPIDIREAPQTIERLIARIDTFRSEAEKAREEAQRAKAADAAAPSFDRATGERERAWAAKALEGVAADLAATIEGGRNHALNAAAYRMGRMAARGWIDEASVRAALEDACRQNGLWKDDGPRGFRATFNSGWRSGTAKPHEDLQEREEDLEYERIGAAFVAALERKEDGTLYDPETGEVFEEGHSDANSDARSETTGREKPRSNEAPPGGKRVDLEMVVASSFAGKPIPKMEWGVEGFIPANNVTLLYADGGTGKSLIALQLAEAAATDTSWLGLRPKAGKVLFISAEDEIDELHRRLARFSPRLEALDDLVIIPLAGKEAVLAAPEKGDILKETPLFKAISHVISERRPAWVILDTLADLFGGDEIKKTQARQFIGLLRGLALKYSVTILLLAHPSQSGKSSGEGTSGNTAWSNSVRSRIYLDRKTHRDGPEVVEDDPDLRVLKLMKSNRCAIGAEIIIRYCNGEFIREHVPDAQTQDDGNKANRVFLSLLSQFEGEGRSVSDRPSSAYAPAVFAKHPSNQGVTKRGFERAMNHLFEAKRIRIEITGSPSRERRRIVTIHARESWEGANEDG